MLMNNTILQENKYMNQIKIECPKCGYNNIEASEKAKADAEKNLAQALREMEKDIKAKAEEKAKADAEKNLVQALRETEKDIKAKAEKKAKADAEKKYQEKQDKVSKEQEIINRRQKKKLDEMTRQLQQRSSEVQGEVQEELIEDFLTRKFPKDNLVTIRKGKNGADCILNCLSSEGVILAKILIESKNTKSFSEGWVPKILDDMINEGADAGIIISETLPASFPEDELWAQYHGGKIGLIPFKYQQVYALVDMFRTNIINSKKSNNINKTSRDLKKLWECITSPKFTAQYRQMLSISEKMKEQSEKLKTTVNKQIAALGQNIELSHDTQKEILYDIVKSVGEDKLPIELIEFDEEKK